MLDSLLTTCECDALDCSPLIPRLLWFLADGCKMWTRAFEVPSMLFGFDGVTRRGYRTLLSVQTVARMLTTFDSEKTVLPIIGTSVGGRSPNPGNIIALELESGRLVSGVSDRFPAEPGSTGPKLSDEELNGNSLLRWIETFTSNVREGYFRLHNMDGLPPTISPISHHPSIQNTATTNGVVVQTSPLFIHVECVSSSCAPHHCCAHSVANVAWNRSTKADAPLVWTYRIRMWMTSDAPMSSCQLRSRHWEISMLGQETEIVDGPAVVGEYPLLKRSEGEDGAFEYQSFTRTEAAEGYVQDGEFVPFGHVRGVMKGSFQMVPGSLSEETGEQFDATVPEFVLRIPEYIF